MDQDNLPKIPDHPSSPIHAAPEAPIGSYPVEPLLQPISIKRLVILLFVSVTIFGSVLFMYIDKKAQQVVNKAAQPTLVEAREASRLFETMIDQSLQTTSMTEQRIVKDNAGVETRKVILIYDLDDMKQVRMFGSTNDKIETSRGNFNEITWEHISVPEGLYLRYKTVNNLNTNTLGHWFPVIQDGKLDQDGQAMSAGDPTDLQQAYLGFYIPGNYGPEFRTKAAEFIRSRQLYSYDTSSIQQVKDGRKTYYVYDVSIASDKEIEFNRMVAATLGVERSAKNEETAVKYSNKLIKFCINKDTARLERVDIPELGGKTQTIYYYDYNSPTDIQKPSSLTPAAQVRNDLEQAFKVPR